MTTRTASFLLALYASYLSMSYISYGQPTSYANSWSINGAISVSAVKSDRFQIQGQGSGDEFISPIELSLNASRVLQSSTVVGAQIYAYELGDFRELTIDWAHLEHSFAEEIGVRLGRYRFPGGYFQESQDVDEAHVFAFLPDQNYRKTNRANRSNIDGVQFFGLLDGKRNGRIEYKAFGGYGARIKGDNVYIHDLNSRSLIDINRVDLDLVYGLQLQYHTPINGLSFHISYSEIPDTKVEGEFRERESFEKLPGRASFLPASIDQENGPGTWDSLYAGTSALAVSHNDMRFFAVNYENQYISFNAEWHDADVQIDFDSEIAALNGKQSRGDLGWAVMGSYRASDKWELGAYYDEYYPIKSDRSGEEYKAIGQNPSHAWQKQWVATIRHNLNLNTNIKLEYHRVNGLAFISNVDSRNGNFRNWDPNWDYIVLKSTWTY